MGWMLAIVSMAAIRIKLRYANAPKGLEGYGLKIVKRIPIEIKPNNINLGYLKTKKKKMGHLFDNI